MLLLVWWLEGYEIEDLQYLSSFKIVSDMLGYSYEISRLLSECSAHLKEVRMASCSIEDSLDRRHSIGQLCLHIVLILHFPQRSDFHDKGLALAVRSDEENGDGIKSGSAHWRLFIISLGMTPHL